MRLGSKQQTSLGESFKDEPKLEVLEVAKPAMNELGAARGGPLRKVILFDQGNPHPPGGGITSDRSSSDSSAHDQQVKSPSTEGLKGSTSAAR